MSVQTIWKKESRFRCLYSKRKVTAVNRGMRTKYLPKPAIGIRGWKVAEAITSYFIAIVGTMFADWSSKCYESGKLEALSLKIEAQGFHFVVDNGYESRHPINGMLSDLILWYIDIIKEIPQSSVRTLNLSKYDAWIQTIITKDSGNILETTSLITHQMKEWRFNIPS